MSEETIQQRYAKVDELLKRLLEYREPRPNSEAVYRQARKLLKDLMTERTKYPLAPVSTTLDRLLDGFDGAAEGEMNLGEIEHKGEKVTVKIKVVRGTGDD